ncbi:hypothetical protein [Actinokineospora sp. NPDC004072]
MPPQESRERWEAAYRRYAAAGESTGPFARQAELTAAASWEVARAWREIAQSASWPWWLSAALDAAAEAYEDQAREYDRRAREARQGSDVRQRRR